MSHPPDSQPVTEAAPAPAQVAPTIRRRVIQRAKGKRAATPRPRPARSAPSLQPTLADVAAEKRKEGFFKRYAVALIVGGFVVAGGAGLLFYKPGPNTVRPAQQERIVMIAPLPAPPPPPPPPPKIEPPKVEEKMEKETAAEEAPKPIEKPQPAKAPDDPAPLGTNLKGDGPGLSGLGTGSGLGGGTIGGEGGGKGGSRFGWYAGQVRAKISEALRKHPQTKNASLQLDVRIWPDPTGRIARVQLIGSTGDPALDRAIQGGVLTGLQLQEPPPAGMKLPINLRLTARRPN
jgi:protein TonB